MKATNEDRSPQFIASCLDNINPQCHTVKVPIFDYEILVTRDPENVRAIFCGTTAADYDISASRAASWFPMLGRGIFTTRGWEWKHSRSMLRGQFARDVVADVEREERHVQCLIERILASNIGSVPAGAHLGSNVKRTSGRWTEKLDLLPLFFNFTLDTASEFLYGESVHSQQGNQDGIDIATHFHKAKVTVHRRVELDKFYWICNSSSFRKSCSILHHWVDSIVEQRLAQLKNQEQNPALHGEKKGKFVLLDELARGNATDNDGSLLDAKQLRSETLNVLAAGRDTTGSLLGWVFYFLARYPVVYAKLRLIVLQRFGSHPTASTINFQDLRSCNYLQYVMKEALRVATVIPMNERTALRDTILPVGGGPDGKDKVFVPEGTQILIPTYAMQHRRDLWGDDVEEFVPERWETTQPGWEYIPFGAGERKCLGRKLISCL